MVPFARAKLQRSLAENRYLQGGAQMSCQECSVNLVKTPEASPKVVLLALWIASSSVSKAKTDMTGPKISSFTQVISSLQLSVTAERSWTRISAAKKGTDSRAMMTAGFTENTRGHEVTSFQFGVTGDERLSSTKHSGSLQTQTIHSSCTKMCPGQNQAAPLPQFTSCP